MRKRTEPDAVNLTPMIDIVFQMIIFFVFTIDLDKAKFDDKIELHEAVNSPEIKEFDPMTIYPQVLANGRIKVGAAQVSPGQFRGIVERAVQAHGQHIPVMIYAASETRHIHVKRVMDICSESGLWKINVLGMVEEGQ